MIATPTLRLNASLVMHAALTFVALALVGILAAAVYYVTRTPTQASAASIVYGDLLAFEHIHGDAHVVFFHRDRVYFDHLRRDWKYASQPDTYGWVLTGLWYFIPASDEPASAGVARCTGVLGERCDNDTEIFGQINTPGIVSLEVAFDDERRLYEVTAPGYAVRLDGFVGTPDSLRWLNANGDVVWTVDSPRALRPGE